MRLHYNILLCSLVSITSCHHLLVVHNQGAKSHLIQIKPVIEELLERGHTVSSVIFDSVKIIHKDYTEIVIPNDMDQVWGDMSKMFMKKGGTSMLDPALWWWGYTRYSERMEGMSLDMFRAEEVKKMIRDRTKIDAVITMMPENAIFADIFDCPLIAFSPASPLPFMMRGSTNIINHSIHPFLMTPAIEPMTFTQRISNHLMFNMADTFMTWKMNLMFEHQRKFLQAELGLNVAHPSITTKQKFSVILACSHVVTHGAWQYLPNVIQVRKDNPFFVVISHDLSHKNLKHVLFSTVPC